MLPTEETDIDVLLQALRSIGSQIQAVLEQHATRTASVSEQVAPADPAVAVLARVEAAGGRLHKLEVHQAAREVGLEPAALARLYTASPPLLVTEHQDRVLTDAGREHLASVG